MKSFLSNSTKLICLFVGIFTGYSSSYAGATRESLQLKKYYVSKFQFLQEICNTHTEASSRIIDALADQLHPFNVMAVTEALWQALRESSLTTLSQKHAYPLTSTLTETERAFFAHAIEMHTGLLQYTPEECTIKRIKRFVFLTLFTSAQTIQSTQSGDACFLPDLDELKDEEPKDYEPR